MTLLFRFLRFLVILAFRIAIRLVGILIRLLIPLFRTAVRRLSALVFLSLVASINGPRQFTERLASEWTRQLLDRGVSRDHLDQIYRLCQVLAIAAVALGWVVSTLITVLTLYVLIAWF